MAKYLVLLLILAVIAGMAWLLIGKGRKPGRHSRARSGQPLTGTRTTSQLAPGASQLDKMREGRLFWGVSLQNPGCDASMELFEQELPLADAPNLPLDGCDAMQCSCSWKGLTEQRHTTRRTHHDRRDNVRFDEQEDKIDRRSHKERRKTENTWDRRDF